VPGRPLTVLKLGGSVLRGERDLAQAAHEVYRWAREGSVVVVVSALRGATDGLIAQAERLGPQPQPAALAALVATGEQAAAALLALALDRAGLPAEVLDAARLGLHTRGALLEAEPVHLDVGVLDRVIGSGAVAVVPGFLGRTVDGAISLLGRGGSDYTALFLADRLRAGRCRLIKDTDGLYDRDPARHAGARRYAALSWDDALRLGGGVVQSRALRFARARRLEFEVGTWRAAEATRVGAGPARLASALPPTAGPARVALLGLGTVGLGVYRLLEAQRALFQVVGIGVRDPRRHVGEAPASLLTTDARAVVDAAEVVVEATLGEEPAASLARRALIAGKAVVSANKALVAAHGPELERLAARHGAALRFSAAVGGAVPVLETAARLAAGGRLHSVEGVLNGTTGFVLDRLAEGRSLEEAVRRAQSLGLAEADPSRDLEGIDLEAKLRVLARVAFGREAGTIARRGIVDVPAGGVREGKGRLRLVGRLLLDGRRLRATVAPERLPATHPLGGLRDEQNGVVFHLKGGPPVVLRGKGAGRWPTAEALVADLLDLARERPGAEVAAADGVSA
jgi:homoserine dehydrogenase